MTAQAHPGEAARRPGNCSPQAEPPAIHAELSYILFFLIISFVYLCTLSDAYFGLISNGQVMFHTAVSLHEFGELGIGPEFDPNIGAMIRPEHYAGGISGDSILH